ncbi:MAG: DNA polymerase III subunit beta [Desulfovibrionales bacterium]
MKLSVLKEDVIEGVQKAAGIIPAKTGAAFLRTVWLRAENGTLKIMSTDSNLEFCGNYPAKVEEPGLAGIQGKRFYDLLRRLPPGEISLLLDADNDVLLLKQGRRNYKLPTNDVTWFQDFARFPADNAVLWSGDFLKEIIDRIAFCISDEDNMEAMKCMKATPSRESDVIEVCGLNGHQFALFRFINEDIFNLLPREGILVHKKYLLELKKWITTDEIEFNLDNKRLFFSSGEQKEIFSLPLSYYEYPNYENFLSGLDDNASTLELDKYELMDSLERISIFNTDNQICTYFVMNGNELTLFAQGQDIGEASELVNATYDGNLQKIAFPTKKLIEILSHYDSGIIQLKFMGELSPCIITGNDDREYKTIIMPMEISEETYYTEENL